MSFGNPWLLLVAPVAVFLVLVIARRGRRAVPATQHRLAVALRVLGVLMLVLALSAPVITRASGDKAVLFLLDRSASIDAAAREAQEAFVVAALDTAGPNDISGVALFGSDLRLDAALAENRRLGPIRTAIDASGTDLAGALRAAAAVLPTEGSRRVVVLTDAVETSGNARAAAKELADAGIAVDVIVLDSGRSSDVLITGVDAPLSVQQGDVIPIEIDIESTITGTAVVTVEVGDESFPVEVEVVPGRNTVRVTSPASESGVLRVRATVDAVGDTVIENNTAELLLRVAGPAKVGVIEGRAGDGAELIRALESGNMNVHALRAIPSADDMLLYDALILVNVAAPGDDVGDDLGSFVEDFGRGLVVIGGDQAFGLGGYEDTRLEELLPVASNPDDLIRRQPVAEVLLIDTSGSMAACHCGTEFDGVESSGVNKTDISRAGAGLAITALQPTDRVGVLAFTSGTRWALPLDYVPSGDKVAAALNTLVPEGDTEIAQGLREATAALADAPEEIRHIVLFTDGWGEDPDLLDAARAVADAGITLSVLGTGEGTGETLRRVAALGGGRFYAGYDLASVPEVFVEETLKVARPLVAEGAFLPVLGAASQVTAGLRTAPPLGGYVLTRPKATAAIVLEVGAGDPLLATWQRGLGRSTVWTSDATTRWSADWVSWDGYVDFWGRLVRDVLPPGLDTPPSIRLSGGFLEIEFEADAPIDAAGIAQVRSADGTVTAVPLQRTDENTFSGRVAVDERGAYWVAVRVENADGIVAAGSNGIVAAYSDEFAFRDPDPTLPADIADATSGRVGPVAAEVFDPAPLRGAAGWEMWPLLAAIALALFFVDVALRRLVLARGDFKIWKEAVVPGKKEPVKALSTKDTPEGAVPDREVHPEEQTIGALLKKKRR